jgi:NAD(P)-dependent dehydrogenase (short-subunit alcohol dehydrogenase family)
MDVLKQFNLKGKVAVVTGGAGVLGPKFVEALAEAGAKVVLADISEDKGPSAAKSISKCTGVEVIFEKLDVTDKEAIENLTQKVLKKWKRIDILINAAIGVGRKHFGPAETYAWEDWEQVMRVTAGGTFLCTQVIGGYMAKKKSGTIINIGSIYGVVGADQRIYGKSGINSPAVYAASKGAIISMTRYFAAYWGKKGVRVNSLSPGGVWNNQDAGFVKKYSARTPMGRMVQKDELKGAVIFFASSASSFVTGQNLMVDGGWTAW